MQIPLRTQLYSQIETHSNDIKKKTLIEQLHYCQKKYMETKKILEDNQELSGHTYRAYNFATTAFIAAIESLDNAPNDIETLNSSHILFVFDYIRDYNANYNCGTKVATFNLIALLLRRTSGDSYKMRDIIAKRNTYSNKQVQILDDFIVFFENYTGELSEACIDTFIHECRASYVLSSLSTMRQRRTIVIAFFKYINQHTCFSVNIETLFHMVPKYNADKKTVVPRRDLGDVAAVHQIISIIKSTFALYSHATSLNRIEYSQVRNAAVSMILLKSALRANEVLNLEFGDIRESEFNNVLEISVKQGKGRKDRTVFAQKKDTQDAIDILRRHNESTFICQTYKHKKMSYQNLRASIEKFFEMHNVCVNGLHRFRHAYTGDMKNSGADPLFVKEQLGHTDFKTTQRYMQDDASERARILHDHLAKWKQL